MRWFGFSSVLFGMLIIGVGWTYVPYFAWCEYWDSPVGTKISRHFTFYPPSQAQALRELTEALPQLNISDHWEEKVAATAFEPMTQMRTVQGLQSIYPGLTFIALPIVIALRKRKQQEE